MALSRTARVSSLSQSIFQLSIETTVLPQLFPKTGTTITPNTHDLRRFTLQPNSTKKEFSHFSKNTFFQSRGISSTQQFQQPYAQAAIEYYDYESETEEAVPELGPTEKFDKPRVVVLGTGWGACRFMKDLDTETYDVVCISPRNHMVLTPLLASSSVGTLKYQSVVEPVNQIQTALAKSPGSHFFQANCTWIDADNHQVYCTAVSNEELPCEPYEFKVAYDKLVIAVGAQPKTFNIKGVYEYATFLREVYHAPKIRHELLLNLMLAERPGTSAEEKRHLLHCAIVGGGPSGVEFAGELSEFIMRDVHQRYKRVKDYVKITLIEANDLLASFDPKLRMYATYHLTKSGVNVVRALVKEVQEEKILLRDGTEIPYGLLVWSTGVGPCNFVNQLDLPKSHGRIGVDEWLRVPSVRDVFALGDCAGYLEQTGKPVLPALGRVAEKQGKYLATVFETIGKQDGGKANGAKKVDLGRPFEFSGLRSMSSIGRYKA